MSVWMVYEEAIYANVYKVHAATQEEALALVKDGDTDPDERTCLRVLGGKYEVKPAPDWETELALPTRDVFANTEVTPGPDPFSDEAPDD
jgi:hypothetical protein